VGKKSNIEGEVDFGTVILDTDVEDITAPWRNLLRSVSIENDDYIEKFCLYLTLYNNYYTEHKEDYPKWISKVDTYGAFFGILLTIAMNYPDETIVDIKPLFEFWVDFLNDNVDTFDRLESLQAYDIALNRFSMLMDSILSDENNDEQNEK